MREQVLNLHGSAFNFLKLDFKFSDSFFITRECQMCKKLQCGLWVEDWRRYSGAKIITRAVDEPSRGFTVPREGLK